MSATDPEIAAPNWLDLSYNEVALKIPGTIATTEVLGAIGRKGRDSQRDSQKGGSR
jgi:hypothetical protein